MLSLPCGGRGGEALIAVRFGPELDEGKPLADSFIAFVDSAQQTLDGAFYQFRHDRIVDAFIRAHKHGVSVRLVVDDDSWYGRDDEGNQVEDGMNPYTKRLVDAAVAVIDDKQRSGLMHNKFAIADGREVWTGSFNLTDTGAYKNSNNAVRVRSEELAAVYTREFDEMFVDGSFGIKSPSTREDQGILVGASSWRSSSPPRTIPMPGSPRSSPTPRRASGSCSSPSPPTSWPTSWPPSTGRS